MQNQNTKSPKDIKENKEPDLAKIIKNAYETGSTSFTGFPIAI